MRWHGQTLTAQDPNALPGLESLAGLVRTVRTPEFAGITFHEVRCRSALNQVPASSRSPFRWTVNPYRGCSHACVYCFARATHTYLDLDPGDDFDRQIVVKTNVAEVLGRELARPTWQREHVALGTNTDPYQRAEGRYRLMPAIVRALAGSGTPFSILTKGTLLGRDLPLIAEAGARVEVRVSVSLALLDPVLQATLEPGTPTPRARLDLVRRIRAAGTSCGVLVAPILPHLTDSDLQLRALFGELAAAGATSISGMPLHLRPGTREWFLAWLAREHPRLVEPYAALYRRGPYVARDYADDLQGRLRRVADEVGVSGHPERGRTRDGPVAAAVDAGSAIVHRSPARPVPAGRAPRSGSG